MTGDGAVADPPSDESSSRRNSGLVAAGIGLSRLSGLLRERAIGHFVGTSFAADAYSAAVRLPNLLQHLLGEGTLSASFIPTYSRLLHEGRNEEAGRVAGAVLGLLAVVTGSVAVAGVVFARPLTAVVAAGLRDDEATFELTVRLVRVLFPSTAMLVLSAWCLGVLNSHRRFFLSYVAPVAMNVAQVAALVVAGATLAGDGSDRLESLMVWLAIGTVVGGLLQLVVQLPAVVRSTHARPNLRWRLPEVRRIRRTFVPVVGARGVVQISRFVQLLLASFLAVGALATLRYAQALVALPIALFGASVAAAELPEMLSGTQASAAASTQRLRAASARVAAFIVPSVVVFVILGDLVAGVVLQSGNFGSLDATAVWFVLAAAAIGLLPTASSRVAQSSLYATGDAASPARIAVVRVLIAAAIGWALMLQLDRVLLTSGGLDVVGDLPALGPLDATESGADPDDSLRLGAVGLALGGSAAAWIEYVLLRRRLRRRAVLVGLGGGELRRIVAAGTVAAALAAAMRPLVSGWHPLVAGPLAISIAGCGYLLVARRLGVTEITAWERSIRRRI